MLQIGCNLAHLLSHVCTGSTQGCSKLPSPPEWQVAALMQVWAVSHGCEEASGWLDECWKWASILTQVCRGSSQGRPLASECGLQSLTQGSFRAVPYMLKLGRQPATRLLRQLTQLQHVPSPAGCLVEHGGTCGTHASMAFEPSPVEASHVLAKCWDLAGSLMQVCRASCPSCSKCRPPWLRTRCTRPACCGQQGCCIAAQPGPTTQACSLGAVPACGRQLGDGSSRLGPDGAASDRPEPSIEQTAHRLGASGRSSCSVTAHRLRDRDSTSAVWVTSTDWVPRTALRLRPARPPIIRRQQQAANNHGAKPIG